MFPHSTELHLFWGGNDMGKVKSFFLPVST